jgi:1-acyl-sn-glycerol-3-phosphate acyltransferase
MIKALIALYFKATGWKFVNNIPGDVRSFVMVGAPHTSNYDFIPAMAVAHLCRLNAKFVVKSDLLKFPLGLFVKSLGGVGVDRERLKTKGHASYTDLMADLFKQYPDLVLMIAPEATRGANPHWKTGFYYIAKKAAVPLVMGYADYSKKEAGLDLLLYPSDFDKDMKAVMNFFKAIKGKYPENFKIDEKYR